MEGNGLTELLDLQGLFAFFIAYGIYFLFARKTDPRFSLKYRKPPSLFSLLGISTLEKIFFLALLVIFSLVPPRDLYAIFGLNMNFTYWLLILGFITGTLIFISGIIVKMLISFLRRKFSINKTFREVQLSKLLEKSLPSSPSEFFMVSFIMLVLTGIVEEIIFRGYVLSHLLSIVHPVPAIILQAVFFFVLNLYQDVYNALIPFVNGTILGATFLFSGSLFTVIIARLTSDLASLLVMYTLRTGVQRVIAGKVLVF